jgi:hypothetical protein
LYICSMVLLLITLLIAYPLALHHYKNDINLWLDIHFAFLPSCRFCRGFHFGTVHGLLLALLLYLLLS